jgi:hypothetical protein
MSERRVVVLIAPLNAALGRRSAPSLPRSKKIRAASPLCISPRIQNRRASLNPFNPQRIAAANGNKMLI